MGSSFDGGTLTNDGTVTTSSGVQLNLGGVALTNRGAISVGNNSTATMTAGSIDNTDPGASLTLGAGGTFNYDGGAITGNAIRLNGDTGVVELDIAVPELSVGSFGPYGGAVDQVGDFWFHSRDSGLPHPLVHVDADGAAYEIINVPDPVNPYGITVDSNGRIWLAGYQGGIGRYDPMLGTWDTVVGFTGLGIQEDAEGVMWLAIYPWDTLRGLYAFDVNTMAHLATIDMTAEAPSSRGVSIDFDGYVWMIDQDSSAWRVDPTFGTWERYQGLTGPYTYSDMTGWGLSLVTPG